MEEHPRTDRERRLAIACILAAISLVVLDTVIANVALPTIAQSLHTTPALSVWVVTAYQAALVMALLPCAALGESVGYRRIYTAGIAVFMVASALCACAPSLPWLVVARFLQGLGGAAIMSLGVALMRLAVPLERLGAAIGWVALVVALSSAAGPTIGAAILSKAAWPWLFIANLPLGIAVLLATRAHPGIPGTGRRLDVLSIALNAGMFALLVAGAELLAHHPALASCLLLASGLTFWSLVRREMSEEAPIIPLDLLRDKSFRTSVMASICCFAGQSASMVALPFYLQHVLGQSTLATGLYMTPWPLTVAIAAPIAGRYADRISTAHLCAAGGALLSIGLLSAALFPLQGDLRPLVIIMMVCGVGFGMFQVPNNRNMFLSSPQKRSGAAGGMQSTARLTGQTAGALIMTLLYTLAPIQTAPRTGLAIGAALTLTAGLISLRRVVPFPGRSAA